MLDAIKGLAGGGKAKKQAEELEALIATAREERRALDATVKAVTVQSAKLTETGTSLEQVNAKAVAATGSLDAVAKRIEELERAARAVVDIEKKAQGLDATISMAHATTEKLIAPDGDLEKHRRRVQELATETANAQVAAVHGDLEQLRGLAGQLGQDYAKIRDAARDAREDSSAAVDAVREVENKLGRLAQLQELSRETEAKLTALSAVAEHVSQKTRALDSQKHIVDRAVVEANRVNELVWNMDVQIGKLNEGLKQVARGEEATARMEDLAEDIHGRVGAATRMRDEFMHDSARMEKDGRALVGLLRANVEKLALEKQEFEALSERLRAMQEAVQESEQRMEALGVKERHLSLLPQRIDEFSRAFEALMGQADELSRKQAGLDTLRERLSQVDDLSMRTASQHESLKQSRTDLETLRKEIQDFHRSYADVAQLRDKLGADRSALEAFVDRLASFQVRASELDATMDAVLPKMSLVDEGTRQVARLDEITGGLDAHLTRVTDRMEVVEIVQQRLDTLHAVASEVDGKLAAQLARRGELETLKTQCDGVVTQMLDAQQKLESVAGQAPANGDPPDHSAGPPREDGARDQRGATRGGGARRSGRATHRAGGSEPLAGDRAHAASADTDRSTGPVGHRQGRIDRRAGPRAGTSA